MILVQLTITPMTVVVDLIGMILVQLSNWDYGNVSGYWWCEVAIEMNLQHRS